ncbi:MAG: hypothetical protein KKD01_04155 [Proteobacteria bacterium]|nr:hypothetical protein [Pseudomonadota bacterium]MBU1419614.1 hypothetical protein [Pseudomonadota bacterium]MBU1453899.1 hypothetical protein [Pseudomonadota bacterium]
MKKIAVLLSLLLLSIVAVSAIAADKVVVVPLNSSRVQPELVPLAQGEISTYTGNILSTGHYGISSTVLNGTGDVTVTFTSSWVGYPAVMTGSWATSALTSNTLVYYNASINSNTIRFYTKDSASGALENGYFSFVVFGQKQ